MISTDLGCSPDESAPDLEQATDRPPHQQLHDQRRRPTFSVHRLLVCYAITAIAVACGALAAVAVWVSHPPRRPSPLSSSAARRVLSRSGVLAVVLLLVPASLNLLT